MTAIFADSMLRSVSMRDDQRAAAAWIEGHPMRFVLKTVLAVAVLLAAVTGWFRFTPFALKGVEVTSGECNTNPFSDAAVKSSWAGSMYQLAIEKSADRIRTSLVDRLVWQRVQQRVTPGGHGRRRDIVLSGFLEVAHAAERRDGVRAAENIDVDFVAGRLVPVLIVLGDRLDAATLRLVGTRVHADDDLLEDFAFGFSRAAHAGEGDDRMNGRRAILQRGSPHETLMVVSDRAVLRVDDPPILCVVAAEPG